MGNGTQEDRSHIVFTIHNNRDARVFGEHIKEGFDEEKSILRSIS
jgi:hypothetical protein